MLMGERERDQRKPGYTTAEQCEGRDITQDQFEVEIEGVRRRAREFWWRLDS